MHATTDLELAPRTPPMGPAEILELHPSGNAVRVLRGDGEDPPAWARLAIPRTASLRPGATALVAAGDDEVLYVIGIVEPLGEPPARRSLVTTSGASAHVTGPADAERVQVFSETGQLIFEYDPAARCTRMHAPAGDLQLVADAGRIDLIAGDEIRLHSNTAVDIAGCLGVRLEAGQGTARDESSLRLQPHTAQLSAPHLRLSAAHLDARSAETQISAGSVTGQIQRARLVMGTLELVAGTLVESARTLVQRVAGLFHLRAANAHLAVDENCQIQGERVVVKADEDVKVLGEQIHLG